MHPAIQAIERRRESAGLSIREIEARAALGHSTYAKLVNGTTAEPKLPQIEAIAAAFDWPLAELLGLGGGGDLAELPLDQLRADPENPRRHFDEEALGQLAQSIAEQGLLQNLVVREAPPDGGPPYVIVAGERRWRALGLLAAQGKGPRGGTAGRVACRIVPVDAEAQRQRVLALIENLQREDLSALDAGRAFQTLNEKAGWTFTRIAEAIGKTDAYVRQRVALLKLIPAAQEALDGESITFSQARALARANPSEQPELLARILKGGLADEHAIDDAAKELGRAHASGDAPADGKVRLDNPGAGSGDSAAPTQFMKDAAADYLAKHPEGYQGPGTEEDAEDDGPYLDEDEDEPEEQQRPVPPIFYHDREVKLSAKTAKLVTPLIQALLPETAESGDSIDLGHPEAAPQHLHIVALARFDGEPGWEVSGWSYSENATVGSGCLRPYLKDIEAFLQRGAELGFLVLRHRSQAEERAKRAAAAKAAGDRFDLLTGLQIDSLAGVDCRLLAADAIELARCMLRHERLRLDQGASTDWTQVRAAEAAIATQEQKLVALVLRTAERQPAAATAPAPTPAPLSADDDRLLDIPPILRRS